MEAQAKKEREIVRSVLVQSLESAYDCGDLDPLKNSIVPFLRANKKRLIEFIQSFQQVEGPCPLDQLVKIFIIQTNLPFDMSHYMNKQSSAIKNEVETCECLEERQKKVATWIQDRAASHRSQSMFEQVFCFEKLKDSILPLIKEELGIDC